MTINRLILQFSTSTEFESRLFLQVICHFFVLNYSYKARKWILKMRFVVICSLTEIPKFAILICNLEKNKQKIGALACDLQFRTSSCKINCICFFISCLLYEISFFSVLKVMRKKCTLHHAILEGVCLKNQFIPLTKMVYCFTTFLHNPFMQIYVQLNETHCLLL